MRDDRILPRTEATTFVRGSHFGPDRIMPPYIIVIHQYLYRFLFGHWDIRINGGATASRLQIWFYCYSA